MAPVAAKIAAPKAEPSPLDSMLRPLRPIIIVALLALACQYGFAILSRAYTIRLHAIENFGYSEFAVII